MNTSSRPKWPIQLIATAVVFVVAALVVPAAAGAKQYKAHGVRAEIKQGTLEVKGNQRANTVALRLKAGDQTRSRSTWATTATPISRSHVARCPRSGSG